jgi:hypothetical protein
MSGIETSTTAREDYLSRGQFELTPQLIALRQKVENTPVGGKIPQRDLEKFISRTDRKITNAEDNLVVTYHNNGLTVTQDSRFKQFQTYEGHVFVKPEYEDNNGWMWTRSV